MTAFVFRPFCDFYTPLVSCSNGWLMYYVLSLLTAIAFRSIPISILNWAILVAAWYFTSFGIPIPELTFNWIMGSIIGYFIFKKFKKAAPPFVTRGVIHNVGGFLQMALIVLLAMLLYFNVDMLITENQKPYGLVITFIMIACYLFAACFFLYCVLGIEALPAEKKLGYWLLWFNITVVVFMVMFAGFIPNINSYIKSAIVTPLAALAVVLIR